MFAIKILLFLFVLCLGGWVSIKFVPGKNDDGENVPVPKLRPLGLFFALVLLVVTTVLLGAVGQIPAGSRGVVLRFGAVTGRTLNEGIYLVTPFMEQVQRMSVQVEAFKANADAVSKDIQEAHTTVTLNYALDPQRVGAVWKTLGNNCEERIIGPAVQEAVKAVTAKYDSANLISSRETVKSDIVRLLDHRLRKHHVVMDTVNITNFEFSNDFMRAVERKVIAVQKAQEAQNDLQRVGFEAQQKVKAAGAEAESLRLQKAQVTPEMIALRRIEVQRVAVNKWNGILPTFVGGGSPVPVMDIFKDSQSTSKTGL